MKVHELTESDYEMCHELLMEYDVELRKRFERARRTPEDGIGVAFNFGFPEISFTILLTHQQTHAVISGTEPIP